MHVVYATDSESKTWRVSDNLSWGQAQAEWKRLDDCRIAGLMPHIKFFEVRSNIDSQPRFRLARTNLTLLKCVLNDTRGHAKLTDAAHKAWKHTFGDRFHDRKHDAAGERTGVQGRGGWFYYPNGQTAAQGKDGLAQVAKRMGLVVRGVNGRWYVVDADVVHP